MESSASDFPGGLPPTATQKAADGHATEVALVAIPTAKGIAAGVHAVPDRISSNSAISPDEFLYSPIATQANVGAQATEDNTLESSVTTPASVGSGAPGVQVAPDSVSTSTWSSAGPPPGESL
jgi:hypothetical protein